MSIIAIDFDGTCVTHEFPRVGKDIGATRVLRRLVEEGHQLILYTMRSDVKEVTSEDYNIHKQPGEYLSEAVKWFTHHGIPLYGINENPTQKQWTTSPKCYAELYLDDAALGIPLIYEPSVSSRPFVDWNRVEELLIEQGILQEEAA